MDHPSSLPRPHSWRTTAVVAAAVATFELVLLVLIGLAFIGHAVETGAGPVKALTPAKDEVSAAMTSQQSTTPKQRPLMKRTEISVMVLNGNGRAGAAAETADLIRTRSYLIAGTGDAPRTDRHPARPPLRR